MVKRAVVLSCIDFRLNQRANRHNSIGRFTSSLGLDCFLVTRGGGVQDLVRPLEEGYRSSVMRDIRVGVKGHSAGQILLVNHENCAAYAHFEFRDREKELQQHYSDLFMAARIMGAEFPGIPVLLYFAELVPGFKDKFVVKALPMVA